MSFLLTSTFVGFLLLMVGLKYCLAWRQSGMSRSCERGPQPVRRSHLARFASQGRRLHGRQDPLGIIETAVVSV
jgi:hypothetical protein